MKYISIVTILTFASVLTSSSAAPLQRPAASPAASRPAFTLDHVSNEDIVMLVDTARRAFNAAARGQAPLISTYKPRSLRDIKARACVTLRHMGRPVAQGRSGSVDVLDATRAAAEAAVKAVITPIQTTPEWLAKLAIEVELAGPDEYVRAGLDKDLHFDPELYAAFDPGVDGIGVELKGRQGRVSPGVILASGYTPTLALQHAEKDAGFTVSTKAQHRSDIRYFKFPSVFLWQPDAFSRPVRLQRGMLHVAPTDVTQASLDRAIESLAHIVHHRVRRDAWFAYEYLPSVEHYSETNSLFGQFQTAWGVGLYGQAAGDSHAVDMASRLVAAAQTFVLPLDPDIPAKAVLGTRDVPPLASTGLYLAALSRFPSKETHQPGAPIADAIRLVQEQGEYAGRFNVSFPPDPPTEGHAYAAGIAVLALVEYAGDKPNAEVDRTVRVAVRFYRNYFRKLPTRELAAWMTTAMAAAYRRKPDPPVSDLLFEMCDWLAAHQIAGGPGVSADMIGAILRDGDGMPDAMNARCLIALTDGLWMARRLGDRVRAARYEAAAKSSARFIMQLQFRPEECYYIANRPDVVGAVRASLWDHTLHVDDSAMALWALTHARDELYGPMPPAARMQASTP